jgi:hypothetical protein
MIRLIDCQQGTTEWLEARAGIVTSSEFSKVLAKGEGKTRTKYMRQLAGEIITGLPAEGFEGNRHTERGKLMEPAARELLRTRMNKDITEVGFIRNDDLRMGCSPDGLLGANPDNLLEFDAGVEIKCCLPDIQIERLLHGGLPSEYRAQVEGSLLVTGAKVWKFYSYSTGLPAHIVEVTLSDERREFLTAELKAFNTELDAMVAQVKGYY